MEPQILEGYSDSEKGAYLSAIASIATADTEASAEEVEYLTELGQAAGLSQEQMIAVERAATETSGEELKSNLDILRNSELKYSLVADLIAFGKSDQNYSEKEEQNVQKIGQYLGVDQQQFSLLDQFAQNAAQQPADAQQGGIQDMLGFGGLGNKMQNAGINTGGLLKGLISIAAPILISRMLSRGMGGQRGGGGGLGGMLGGNSGGGGGLGGMLGGGGLGSLIGMLSGGRGFGNSGGLLGKILGGGRF